MKSAIFRKNERVFDYRRAKAFTLLEILLVLALLAVLLAVLSAVIRLFSGNYASTERRIGRSQLARSIAQMLSDDLGSAVQDPIQAVADDPNRQFIRRFGLRGDSRSLQIDVVQPNLFATTATAEENRRVAAGGAKSTQMRQVPELKTIFYEFVPINAFEDENNASAASPNGTNAGGDPNFGSELTGSLTSPPGMSGGSDGISENGDASGKIDPGTAILGTSEFSLPSRRLARKFGLSRRELDFETPDEDANSILADASVASTEDLASGNFGANVSGSLSSPPSATGSSLVGTETEEGVLVASPLETTDAFEMPLTAAQIAMDADDGTTWAPEVLDCRFQYFDGETWFDSWDSLEKSGLPVAIKVEMKLAPLDDVDLYRSSPMFFRLPVPPALSELTAPNEAAPTTPGGFESRLVGSLTTPGGLGEAPIAGGPGLDVFNSYRPIEAIHAAQGAASVPVFDPTSLAFPGATRTETAQNGSASSDLTTEIASSEIGASADVAGSLNGANFGLDAASQNAANGAIYNKGGICVDYANDGSYLTLEQMAAELGVTEPDVREVVVYLPTTPLGRSQMLERRRPAAVRPGNVALGNGGGARNSTTGRRTPGANPYSTGRARAPVDRSPVERAINDRSAANRNPANRLAADRTASTRSSENRSSTTREGVSRSSATRAAVGRDFAQRTATDRRLQTRSAGGGTGIDSELAAALDAEGGVFGAPVGSTNEFSGRESVGGVPGGNGFGSTPVGGMPGGGMSGGGMSGGGMSGGGMSGGGLSGANLGASSGATALGGVDPFSIVDAQNVPFSSGSAGFAAVEAATESPVAPGLIEDSTGGATTVSPTSSGAASPRRTQQTWIRGKK